ncbi:MAG TPA: UbiA family prenyltransferase [Fimbriimonas sp.]
MERAQFALAPYWKHMRVPFQLSLAPLFLWGASLATVESWPRLALAFVAFHFFLYTGVTAYNSAFDRDEGPVGGMMRPPEVPDRLLEFSIGLQAVGAVLSSIAGLLPLYLVFTGLGIAYSYPRIRLKRDPVASALVVFLGQGVLGTLAGWVAASGEYGPIGPRLLLGVAGASLTTLGLYPLTQIYQIEEDARRGDRTLAVMLGKQGAIRFGALCLAASGILSTTLMLLEKAWFAATCLALCYPVMLRQVARIGREDPSVEASFLSVTRLNYTASLGFLVFIGLRMTGLL